MTNRGDSAEEGVMPGEGRMAGEGVRPRESRVAAGGPGVTAAEAPGFWLPRHLRDRILAQASGWATTRFARGRECGLECPADEPGAVTACWPVLPLESWTDLLDALAEARSCVPHGEEFWQRLQASLPQAAQRLAEAGEEVLMAERQAPLAERQAVGAEWQVIISEALPAYTGFSEAMIGAMLDTPEMWDLRSVAASFSYRPSKVQAARWERLADLPGRVRFFPKHLHDKIAGYVPVAWQMPLFSSPRAPELVVGYGAGNVPGTALIITLLALATTLTGSPPPAVLVRNSRREPLFSPLVLSVLEEVDEDLVATVAVMIWDYDDPALQRNLLGRADLVLAAAGDETIASLEKALKESGAPPAAEGQGAAAPATAVPAGPARAAAARFHPHGHKVSFAVVGQEMADSLDIVSLLTALDSAYWDQFGCLSARIHFVEKADPGDWITLDYGEHLVSWLRRLAQVLPRGAWPLRQLQDTFDRYKALENAPGATGAVRVVSSYEDPFVVVIDERETPGSRPDPYAFATAINDCQGRVIIIRPVYDLMEVPRLYLSLLPSHSLQSLSVAVGRPGAGLTKEFLAFATACGAQGVTAIRVAGRGALPQLAYSWDGFLPLDLVSTRPAGHFTTIEFDSPYEALIETYKAHVARIGAHHHPRP